jgi:hypothetical protein
MTSGRVLGSAGTILGGIIAWFGFDFLPFEGRIILPAVAVLIPLVAFAFEFPNLTRRMWNRRRLYVAIAAGFIFAAGAVGLSYLTVVWHSVMVSRDCTASKPAWACIEIQLPRNEVQFELRLAVTDLSGPPADWFPGFLEDLAGASASIRTHERHQLTVFLTGAGSTTRYGVSFRTAPQRDLTIDAPGIRLIAWSTLWWWLAFEGGALWILGACLLYYSPSWVPLLAPVPKETHGTGTLVS